ncbi:MAG: hypothetical protein K2Q25_11875 [Mycobacteriaceae bacterium]|nr:hypothetical protein [Mycobacteriaceae bacterium]
MSTDGAVQQWLLRHGADSIAHPGGTLFDHLSRVAARLAEWKAPDEVRVAGLCHAAYGTDGFATALIGLTDRIELRKLIGVRAEHLVYLYGSCVRATVYPQLNNHAAVSFANRFTGEIAPAPAADTRAFVEITAANEIDVMLHNQDLADRHAQSLYELFSSARHWLSAEGWQACSLLPTLPGRDLRKTHSTTSVGNHSNEEITPWEP